MTDTSKPKTLSTFVESLSEYERFCILRMTEIQESMNESGIPIIECERTPSGLRFFCPYCEKHHLHGMPSDAGGHRVAHCPVGGDSPLLQKGYVLKPISGRLPVPPEGRRRRRR